MVERINCERGTDNCTPRIRAQTDKQITRMLGGRLQVENVGPRIELPSLASKTSSWATDGVLD